MFATVECRCPSKNRRKLNAELALHFPGRKGLDKPVVWAFPEALVCLNCGFGVCELADAPLRTWPAYAEDLPRADAGAEA